jgi:hypothetical protein
MGARFYTGFRYRGNEVPAQVLISPLLGNWLFVSNFNVENVEASKKQKILCLLLASKSKAPQLGLHLQIPGQMFYAALRPVEPFFLRSAHLFFIMSDNFFRPSALRRLPFLPFRTTNVGAALFPGTVLTTSVPSSAAMARLSRSLSFFNSVTIAVISMILP